MSLSDKEKLLIEKWNPNAIAYKKVLKMISDKVSKLGTNFHMK